VSKSKSSKSSKSSKRPNFGKHHIEISDSEVAKSVRYDPDASVMEVTFKSGGRYHYEHVSPKMFCRFVLAESMGKFFHAKIRNKYKFHKMG
jgi:hypothetical protein